MKKQTCYQRIERRKYGSVVLRPTQEWPLLYEKSKSGDATQESYFSGQCFHSDFRKRNGLIQ